MLGIGKWMIAKTKHQCWEHGKKWLLKTNINAENKQISNCWKQANQWLLKINTNAQNKQMNDC